MYTRKDALKRMAMAATATAAAQAAEAGVSPGMAEGRGWIHPAGVLDVATLKEMRRKCANLEWARNVVKGLDAGVQPWLRQPLERIEALLPKRKMQVYWLMTCPSCNERLPFDPFNDRDVTCANCHKSFTLDQRSPSTYKPYAGTLYEGWGCSYLMAIASQAEDMALLHALRGERSYAERGAAILKMFARYIKPLPVKGGGTQYVIWTYNMEGDCSIVLNLLAAYELLRGVDGLFNSEEHRAIRLDLFKHWIDAVFRVERDSSPNHNNMYRYLTAVGLAGCAIEDKDYVDWAFGRREYSAEKRPNHHSLAWLTDNNYRPDGGFWGLCSAYHLYTLGPNCQVIVLGHRLSQQMPDLFPKELYDDLSPQNPRSRTMRRAIKWFTAQAFPDLTMAPFGDMGGRVSLASYPMTAEIGYRYLRIDEAGSYRSLREGNRGLTGLVYGVDTIRDKAFDNSSANLSSGYVALKRYPNGNRLYAGLNAVQPGEMHQHGDRLNLLTYSRDRMLTGEKSTRYQDVEQREYSGASYGHNTVTVDETSQVHGSLLKGDRIPHIDTFLDLPAAQVAEAHGDRIYEKTSIYRRLLCQFDEYLLDIFLVNGGSIHDWFFHGVGEEPTLSIPMENRTGFEPALYVVRGKPEYGTGAADKTFTATWRLPAEPGSEFAGGRRDILSRVTVAGVPGQTAFVLNTWPDPGAHSLMVRHKDVTAPFVAVHEASFGPPVAVGLNLTTQPGLLKAVTPQPPLLKGEGARSLGAAVEITHADGGRRLATYGSGSVPGGLSLKGRFGVVELDRRGLLRSLLLVRGTELAFGGVKLRADRETSLSMKCNDRGAQLVTSPPIGYETLEGRPVYNASQGAEVWLTMSGPVSPGGEIRERAVKVPGQAKTGPVSVSVKW